MRIDIGDRLGLEQRILERLDLLMSGSGVPSLTTTPTPTRAILVRLPRTNLPCSVSLSMAPGVSSAEIECFAALDQLGQRARRVTMQRDLVAGLLLEFRHHRPHHLRDRAGVQHLDLHAAHAGTRRRKPIISLLLVPRRLFS